MAPISSIRVLESKLGTAAAATAAGGPKSVTVTWFVLASKSVYTVLAFNGNDKLSFEETVVTGSAVAIGDKNLVTNEHVDLVPEKWTPS